MNKTLTFEYFDSHTYSDTYKSLLSKQLGLPIEAEAETIKMLDTNSKQILNSFEKYNSFLLYGDVQSGKTNNLINIVINLFEMKKIDVVIYLTGTNNDLLTQNQTRFFETLKDTSEDFQIYMNKSLDPTVIEANIRKGKPVIINSLKTQYRLNQIKEFIQKISPHTRFLIIDDEADEASLSKQSLQLHKEMLEREVKFISITASPFKNLYMNHEGYDYYQILKVVEAYNGIYDFDRNIQIVNEPMIALVKGFLKWIITTWENELIDSQLLVNFINMTDKHRELDVFMKKSIKALRDIKNLKGNIEKYYPEYIKHLPNLHKWIVDNLKENSVLLSNGSRDADEIQNKGFEIIIGGIKLSRGITYKNLITEIMFNMGKQINPGTLIQRARWFGYRKKRIEMISIFMSDSIKGAYEEMKDLIKWTKQYNISSGEYKEIFDDSNYEYLKI